MGRGLRLVLSAMVALALATACGDNTTGVGDAGSTDGALDGGIDGDALVDNGPLDCGAPPNDAGHYTCLHGRLYDFVTREPIVPGVERKVYGFLANDFGEPGWQIEGVFSNPDYVPGRLAPNGRIALWIGQFYPGEGTCLALDGPVPGYLGATVNCYTTDLGVTVQRLAAGEVRVFLVPEGTLEAWNDSWPGSADLLTDRPLYLGQCMRKDWAEMGPADGKYRWEFHLNPPRGLWDYEFFSLNSQRTGFQNQQPEFLFERPIPEGGASAYFIPLDPPPGEDPVNEIFGIKLLCGQSDFAHALGNYPEARSSGRADIVIATTVPEP